MIYELKSHIVEAIQFEDNADRLSKIASMIPNNHISVSYFEPDEPILKIQTVAGLAIAHEYDWVIKDMKESVFVLNPEEFHSMYRQAE